MKIFEDPKAMLHTKISRHRETASFLHKQVNHLIGKAIHRYGLLNDGDRIMVAVSGGADSLILLYFLLLWQTKAPINFKLFPVYLDMGFDNGETALVLQEHFQRLGLSYYIEETDIGTYAHSNKNKGKSPCFLCSWNRRKRLFQLTQVLNCNKIALGHNLDDLIETFFMNMCYNGEASTMSPIQEMFKGLVTLIRPLSLVEKRYIERLSTELALPVLKNPCPSADSGERNILRRILKDLYRHNPKAKGNIAHAILKNLHSHPR